MANIESIEGASNGGFLWPSISDAVDTFLRRRHNHADHYERVWRLIHLWEAIEITLSLAAMSRLRTEPSCSGVLRRQREFFYGKTWDQVTGGFKSMQGASDGAIDQWINILDEIAKSPELPGSFLNALKAFLASQGVKMGPLLSGWARACDVPFDFKKNSDVEVRTAMRYVNSFRNRFAHVPFPHDPLEEVAEALESATDDLFKIIPLATSHEKAGESSALTGAFRIGRFFLHGGNMELMPASNSEELEFVFPCKKKGEGIELWSAASMLHIDSMSRPHILTRVKGHDICEYTRFRAEANAVLVRPSAGLAAAMPEPIKAEFVQSAEPEPAVYLDKEQKTLNDQTEITMSDAIDAIRSEDFDTAIAFFKKLTEERSYYHIGWLRLGYAKREKAVRIESKNPKEAEQLLIESLRDLEKAAKHSDSEYQAQALYERSKSAYHLKRLFPSSIPADADYIADAEQACAKSNDKKYLTWLEHVRLWAPSGVRLD